MLAVVRAVDFPLLATPAIRAVVHVVRPKRCLPDHTPAIQRATDAEAGKSY